GGKTEPRYPPMTFPDDKSIYRGPFRRQPMRALEERRRRFLRVWAVDASPRFATAVRFRPRDSPRTLPRVPAPREMGPNSLRRNGKAFVYPAPAPGHSLIPTSPTGLTVRLHGTRAFELRQVFPPVRLYSRPHPKRFGAFAFPGHNPKLPQLSHLLVW